MSIVKSSIAARIPLKLDIEFRRSYARSPEVGQLKNISLTGAFLILENSDLKLDDKITVTFKVSGRVRKINASIIWVNSRGCGLQFLPYNNRDVQIVDDLMYFVESRRDNRRDVLDGIFRQVS